MRWAAGRDVAGPVILCGLAGSTCDAYPARSAYIAGAVVDDEGRRLAPTLGEGRGSAPLIGSADRIPQDATGGVTDAAPDWG